MFIIKCNRDNSYSRVNDKYVIHDSAFPPEEGDEVLFMYNNLEELGLVIMRSDDMDVIDKKLDEINKQVNVKKRKYTDDYEEEEETVDVPPSKRLRRINKKYSSDSYENLSFLQPIKPSDETKKDSKKKRKIKRNEKNQQLSTENNKADKDSSKKGTNCIQSVIESHISDKKSLDQLRSQSKEDLIKKLEEAEKELALAKNLNATLSSKSNAMAGKRSLENGGNKSTTVNDSRTDSDDTSDGSAHDLTDSDIDEASLLIKSRSDKIADLGSGKSLSSDKKNDGRKDEKITAKDDKTAESKESGDTDVEKDNDLFGKNWPEEKMAKLIKQVYCKQSVFDLAISLSSQASHVARRLITGVFKPSGYLDSTFTGQAPRAHKPVGEQQPVKVKPLNEIAKNEIIDFALARAEKKGWKNRHGVAQTRNEVERAMSQRIGELKRCNNENAKVPKKPTDQ